MTKETKTILIQVLLFVTTFITTTLAGSFWTYSKIPFLMEFTWQDFVHGMEFSVPFLLILTVHEFGHYFTAMYHKVKASLPYYIPFPPIFYSIGTLGAVIRIRSRVFSNIQHFDIGLAGPLAGFVVAVALLVYGFKTLPPPEHIFEFHPEYKEYGLNYADHVYSVEYFKKHRVWEEQTSTVNVTFGTNLLFIFLEKFVADPQRVPNPHEMMHYPLLMAGFLALFITSLNLLPIGQLDGGHVVYGLFGRKGHTMIARVFFLGLLLYAGLGYVNLYGDREQLLTDVLLGTAFYYICLTGMQMPARDTLMYTLVLVAIQLVIAWQFPKLEGYPGWVLFALLIGRVLGVHHPPSEIEVPLDPKRQVLGWITLLIFILCFSPAPLKLVELTITD